MNDLMPKFCTSYRKFTEIFENGSLFAYTSRHLLEQAMNKSFMGNNK